MVSQPRADVPAKRQRWSVGQVAAWLDRVGPIQSQTARSPFIGLAARFPGLTHAALTAAYEANAVVRGSVVRGTVHTTTPAAHAVLDAVTRVGQRTMWTRMVKPQRVTLEEVWDGIEAFAAQVPDVPGVLALHHVSGATDFVVHVACPSAHELRDVVLDHLTGREGVLHAETSLIFDSVRGRASLTADENAP